MLQVRVVNRLEMEHDMKGRLSASLLDRLASGEYEDASGKGSAHSKLQQHWFAALLCTLGAAMSALPSYVIPRVLATVATTRNWIKFCRRSGCYVGKVAWRRAVSWTSTHSIQAACVFCFHNIFDFCHPSESGLA